MGRYCSFAVSSLGEPIAFLIPAPNRPSPYSMITQTNFISVFLATQCCHLAFSEMPPPVPSLELLRGERGDCLKATRSFPSLLPCTPRPPTQDLHPVPSFHKANFPTKEVVGTRGVFLFLFGLVCLLAFMLKSSTFKGQSLGRLAQAGAEGAALYLKCWLLNGPGPAWRWGVNLPLRSPRKRRPSSVL